MHQNHSKGFYNSYFPHGFSFNSSDPINCISNKFLDDPENYFQQQMKEGQPFRKMDVDAGGLVGLP